MKRSRMTCAGVIVTLAVASVTAHHSPVMFDQTKQVSIDGMVVEFAWTNPHSSIQLDVPNGNGGVDRWGVEMGSPGAMVRQGWKSTLIKPGDHVTVTIRPLKSGEHGGSFLSVKLADGRVLTNRGFEDAPTQTNK